MKIHVLNSSSRSGHTSLQSGHQLGLSRTDPGSSTGTLAHALYPVTRTAHRVICWDRTHDARTAHVNRTQRGRSRLCGGPSDGLPYGQAIWREGRLANLSSKLPFESQKGRCSSRFAQETILTGRRCLSENKELPSENPLPIFFRWL